VVHGSERGNENAGRAAAGATRPAPVCGQARITGMPSLTALSTRLSVMPEPG